MFEPFPLRDPVPASHPLAAFDEEGIGVFSTHLAIGARRWELSDVTRAEVLREGPQWRPYVATLLAGVLLGLLFLVSALGRASPEGTLHAVGLFVAAGLIFGSLSRLLLLTDTTWLVLHTPRGSERVYRTADHALVVYVATVLSDALRAASRGP
ncbi:hypothetical protein FGE12_28510 [Aggregicoccus sp. 17bor-14]|uniref:DUF6232 family protein n=1 Tax=Myxococcaceae TaxID=31 RepID=UPI00129CDF20|nr:MULTISPECIES: DUF6232 family protein [Myxococcaceae]MBF5046391.1 hypothetical protein [Simulacricoccus sp. 17bor-14]MRI92111.1 hypothetical protein [Aggregicoccus sp. 17bor-14]